MLANARAFGARCLENMQLTLTLTLTLTLALALALALALTLTLTLTLTRHALPGEQAPGAAAQG